MTRKDYVQIASSLAKCAGGLGQDTLLYVADMIATDLKKENLAFKYELFLKTSGVTEETIDKIEQENA